MFTTNPFAVLSSTVPSIALQAFVFLMLALVVIGTLMDIELSAIQSEKFTVTS